MQGRGGGRLKLDPSNADKVWAKGLGRAPPFWLRNGHVHL